MLEKPPEMKEPVTTDMIGRDNIVIKQQRMGYRIAVDSLLLAHFSRPYCRKQVIELGSGPGLISLILAKEKKTEHVLGVDSDASNLELAEENARINGLSERVTFRAGDVRSIGHCCTPGSAALVVANPPFRKTGTGKISPVVHRAQAHHELAGTLFDFIEAASFLLNNRANFTAIFLSERFTEFMTVCREKNLEPKNVRFVHAFRDRPSKVFLIRAVKGAKSGLTVESPLILSTKPGRYSAEAKSILGKHSS